MAKKPEKERAKREKKERKERKKRVRRKPEEARAIILEAAKRVLAERGPDRAGLKDIAREAGVSHALVSHYFGTFDQLVEATLESHVLSVREGFLARIDDLSTTGPEAILEYYFEALGNPLYGRLAAWALLSGRLQAADFFPRRQKGMKVIADAIEERFGADAPFSRDDLELMIIVVTCAGFGYAIGKDVFWESMGHEATPQRDRWLREHLARLIRRQMLGEDLSQD